MQRYVVQFEERKQGASGIFSLGEFRYTRADNPRDAVDSVRPDINEIETRGVWATTMPVFGPLLSVEDMTKLRSARSCR
jgi:hypothetical protein